MKNLIKMRLTAKEKKAPNRRTQDKKRFWVALFLMGILFLVGCRRTLLSVLPAPPKQGDNVYVTVDNKKRNEVDSVVLTVAGHNYSSLTVPYTVTVDTCKDTGTYLTQLDVAAVTTYVDADTGNATKSYDMTVGPVSTEDSDNHYSVYVAHDSDDDLEDLMIDMANAFMDEFDSLARSQYYWAEARFFTNQAISYANAADLILSFGHGNHHIYNGVNLSNTSYGNFVQCRRNGDAEYLAFASCQTLSMNDSGGNPYHFFWVHSNANCLNGRPFSGLHMVMGFRTNFGVTSTLWWNDGDDFLEAFAENLDDGDRVVDAWQEAVGDELDFDDGNNRGTVFYLKEYENDVISTSKDDYIYGNPKYNLWWDSWD